MCVRSDDLFSNIQVRGGFGPELYLPVRMLQGAADRKKTNKRKHNATATSPQGPGALPVLSRADAAGLAPVERQDLRHRAHTPEQDPGNPRSALCVSPVDLRVRSKKQPNIVSFLLRGSNDTISKIKCKSMRTD